MKEVGSSIRQELEEEPHWGWWIASFGEGEQRQSVKPWVPGQGRSLSTLVRADSGKSLRLLHDSERSRPAFASQASCAVIFDGVLYNRDELEEDFEGRRERDANEAELILEAYLRCGKDVLRKIRGIFALIIWDSRLDIFLCARDPVGIYPLFYTEARGELLLSTSIDALLRHPRVSGAVNRAVLAEHLCRQWPKVEETYLEAVHRVPPGHAMRVGRVGRQVYRYWDPAPLGAPVDWIKEGEVEQFDSLLKQAVNRCLNLGPVGIYLSGGLDSVSVAAVAVKECRRVGLQLPWALSLVFSGSDCNEEATQKSVAADLGMPQVLLPLGEAVSPQGLLSSALEVIRTWPTPWMGFCLPAYQHLGLEGKRRGCGVILTGNGGDEWLGVNLSLAADLIRPLDLRGLYGLWNSTKSYYRTSNLRLARLLLWQSGARPLLAAPARRLLHRIAPWALRAHRRRRFSQKIPFWVAPDPVLRREIDQRAESPALEPVSQGFYVADMRLALDHPVMTMGMEEIFESGKRMGLHVLHPFWDTDLVDFLYRTPPSLLNSDGSSKGLVRRSLARQFPDLGFERQKKVWGSNFFDSMLLSEGASIWPRLRGVPALAELGIVDAKTMVSTVDEIIANKQRRNAYRIWEVLSLEKWLRARI